MIEIYLLIKERKLKGIDLTFEEVVYVGQTKNLKKRVYNHKKEKDFDRFKVVYSCEILEEAKEMENKYIKHFDTIYNRSLNGIGQYGTIEELCKLEEMLGFKIDFSLLCEITNVVASEGIKPLFSNKYSYHDFYKVATKAYNKNMYTGGKVYE